MGIGGRIDRLERRARVGRARDIVVVPEGACMLGEEKAGDVVHWPNGAGFKLVVPDEFGADPIAGLSRRQLALIEPGEVVSGHGWRPHPTRGDDDHVYSRATWTGTGWNWIRR